MITLKDNLVIISNPDTYQSISKLSRIPGLLSQLDLLFSYITNVIDTSQKYTEDDTNLIVEHIKDDTNLIIENIQNLQKNNSEILNFVKTEIKNIPSSIIDEIRIQISKLRFFDKLENTLSSRDNFELKNVSHLPDNCDFLVKRDEFPDILIDVKDYDSCSVPIKEVNKFKNDLIIHNNHGILVSLKTPIATKSSIEIEQLVNGKFAIYLSNNNYDINFVIDMIYFIYKLDSLITTVSDETHIILTVDAVDKITHFIYDFRIKINNIKTSAKQLLDSLDSLSIDTLETIILSQ